MGIPMTGEICWSAPEKQGDEQAGVFGRRDKFGEVFSESDGNELIRRKDDPVGGRRLYHWQHRGCMQPDLLEAGAEEVLFHLFCRRSNRFQGEEVNRGRKKL